MDDLKVQRQAAFWQSMMNKYQERNVQLEEQQCQLQHRLEAMKCSMPAALVYNMNRGAFGNQIDMTKFMSQLGKPQISVTSATSFITGCPCTPCMVRENALPTALAQQSATVSGSSSSCPCNPCMGGQNPQQSITSSSSCSCNPCPGDQPPQSSIGSDFSCPCSSCASGQTTQPSIKSDGSCSCSPCVETSQASIGNGSNSSCPCSTSTETPQPSVDNGSSLSSCPRNPCIETKAALPTLTPPTSLCTCNPCLTSGSIHSGEPNMLEKLSLFSLQSADVQYMNQLHELATREKQMKHQIQEMEHREQAYLETLRQADEMWACMEGTYKQRLSDVQQSGDSTCLKYQKMSEQLMEENQRLCDELKDLKLELKQCMERVQGPLSRQLEKERRKSEQLEQELTFASKNIANKECSYIKDMSSLQNQLNCTCRNLCDLNAINEQLKEETCMLQCKYNQLQKELINQKLSEAHTLERLQEAMCMQNAMGDQRSKRESAAQLEDNSLYAVARRLSRTLIDVDGCNECRKLPTNLTDTVKGIKSIVDIVDQGGKKKEGKKRSSTEEKRRPSKEDKEEPKPPESVYKESGPEPPVDRSVTTTIESTVDVSIQGEGSVDVETETEVFIEKPASARSSQTPIEKLSRELSGKLSREPSGKLSREPSGKLSREPSGKLSREPSGKLSREPSRKLSRELSGKLSREPIEKLSREPSGKPSREASEKLSKHSSKRSSKAPSREGSLVLSKEPSKTRHSRVSIQEPGDLVPYAAEPVDTVTLEELEVAQQEVEITTEVEAAGDVEVEVETEVNLYETVSDGINITTTITGSGTLEVITEGPAGIIETTMTYTESGNIEVTTEITEYPAEGYQLEKCKDVCALPFRGTEEGLRNSVSSVSRITTSTSRLTPSSESHMTPESSYISEKPSAVSGTSQETTTTETSKTSLKEEESEVSAEAEAAEESEAEKSEAGEGEEGEVAEVSGAESEADAESEAAAESDAGAESETVVESEADGEGEAGAEGEAGIEGLEGEASAESGAGAEGEADTEGEIVVATRTGIEVGAEVEAVPTSGASAEDEAGAKGATGIECETDVETEASAVEIETTVVEIGGKVGESEVTATAEIRDGLEAEVEVATETEAPVKTEAAVETEQTIESKAVATEDEAVKEADVFAEAEAPAKTITPAETKAPAKEDIFVEAEAPTEDEVPTEGEIFVDAPSAVESEVYVEAEGAAGPAEPIKLKTLFKGPAELEVKIELTQEGEQQPVTIQAKIDIEEEEEEEEEETKPARHESISEEPFTIDDNSDDLRKGVEAALSKANKNVMGALDQANKDVTEALAKANKDVESALALAMKESQSRANKQAFTDDDFLKHPSILESVPKGSEGKMVPLVTSATRQQELQGISEVEVAEEAPFSDALATVEPPSVFPQPLVPAATSVSKETSLTKESLAAKEASVTKAVSGEKVAKETASVLTEQLQAGTGMPAGCLPTPPPVSTTKEGWDALFGNKKTDMPRVSSLGKCKDVCSPTYTKEKKEICKDVCVTKFKEKIAGGTEEKATFVPATSPSLLPSAEVTVPTTAPPFAPSELAAEITIEQEIVADTEDVTVEQTVTVEIGEPSQTSEGKARVSIQESKESREKRPSETESRTPSTKSGSDKASLAVSETKASGKAASKDSLRLSSRKSSKSEDREGAKPSSRKPSKAEEQKSAWSSSRKSSKAEDIQKPSSRRSSRPEEQDGAKLSSQNSSEAEDVGGVRPSSRKSSRSEDREGRKSSSRKPSKTEDRQSSLGKCKDICSPTYTTNEEEEICKDICATTFREKTGLKSPRSKSKELLTYAEGRRLSAPASSVPETRSPRLSTADRRSSTESKPRSAGESVSRIPVPIQRRSKLGEIKCDCGQCECEICSPEMMKMKAERLKAARLAQGRPDDCTCMPDCGCARCTNAQTSSDTKQSGNLETRKSSKEEVPSTRISMEEAAKELSAGSRRQSSAAASMECCDPRAEHPPDCDCLECLCEPCGTFPKDYQTRKHLPNCDCLTCLCDPCGHTEDEPCGSGPCSKPVSREPSRAISGEASREPSREASGQMSREASREASRQESREASREASLTATLKACREESYRKIIESREQSQRKLAALAEHPPDCDCVICKCCYCPDRKVTKKPKTPSRMHRVPPEECRCEECLCLKGISPTVKPQQILVRESDDLKLDEVPTSDKVPAADEVPLIDEELECAHRLDCDCLECLLICDVSCPDPHALPKQGEATEQTGDILKMDYETIENRIEEMEKESLQRNKEMEELRDVIKQIQCACYEAEVRASLSGPAEQMFVAKQRSSFETTMSGLQVALSSLQDKCKQKDHMIATMIQELKLRANSKVFDDMLHKLAIAGSSEIAIDFDRTEICGSLPRPICDPKYGKPSNQLKEPLVCQPCAHPDYPNCPCKFAKVKPMLEEKLPICSHPNYPNCPCVAEQTKPLPAELTVQPQIIESQPEPPTESPRRSSVCGHFDYPNCLCKTKEINKEKEEASHPLEGVCGHADYPHCPCETEPMSKLLPEEILPEVPTFAEAEVSEPQPEQPLSQEEIASATEDIKTNSEETAAEDGQPVSEKTSPRVSVTGDTKSPSQQTSPRISITEESKIPSEKISPRTSAIKEQQQPLTYLVGSRTCKHPNYPKCSCTDKSLSFKSDLQEPPICATGSRTCSHPDYPHCPCTGTNKPQKIIAPQLQPSPTSPKPGKSCVCPRLKEVEAPKQTLLSCPQPDGTCPCPKRPKTAEEQRRQPAVAETKRASRSCPCSRPITPDEQKISCTTETKRVSIAKEETAEERKTTTEDDETTTAESLPSSASDRKNSSRRSSSSSRRSSSTSDRRSSSASRKSSSTSDPKKSSTSGRESSSVLDRKGSSGSDKRSSSESDRKFSSKRKRSSGSDRKRSSSSNHKNSNRRSSSRSDRKTSSPTVNRVPIPPKDSRPSSAELPPASEAPISRSARLRKLSTSRRPSAGICVCDTDKADGFPSNKPEAPLGEVVNSSPMEVTEIRRISPDSLLIKWNAPASKYVTGYEILVDGIIKSRVHSPMRTTAVLHTLALKSSVHISIYAITSAGRCQPPTNAVFQI